MDDLCLKCSDQIRGLCCHVNIPLGEFNIVLEHVHCPFLNIETKLCSDYENRKQIAPWCMHGEGMFGKGGLPNECLYIKKYPKKELKPKVKIRTILGELSPQDQQKLVAQYNVFNNIPFSEYIKLTLKNEESIIKNK